MSSDPTVIEQYATRLQQKAGSRVTRLTTLGVVVGTALGAGPLILEHASSSHGIPHRYAYAVILMGAAAGAYLGHLIGQSRAVALRLQASLALNQLEIERVVRRVEGIRLTLPAPPAPLPVATPAPALPAPTFTPAPALPPAPAVSLPAPTPILTATPATPVFAPPQVAAEVPVPAPMLPPMQVPQVALAPELPVEMPAPAPAPAPVPTVQIVPPPTFEWNAPPTSASGS